MAVAEQTIKVKLNSSRAGHSFDENGRFTGVFSQAAGDIVDMPKSEAERHFQAGLASPAPIEKKG